MDPLVIRNKSCKIYFLVDGAKVYFNADFDSGNIQKVQQTAQYSFKVHPGFDKTRHSTNKTFFHFKVYGLKMCKANFTITRMNILQKLIKVNDKNNQNGSQYCPVYRKPNGQYKKVTLQVKKYFNKMEQPELSFSHQFQYDQYIQFAFTYPYSYQDNQNLINKLKDQYSNHHSIYFNDQILCLSHQKRKVHLLTITERQNCLSTRQQKIEGLFSQQTQSQRSFKINKPVIFLTARVHPGQSPASFCIEGVIKFILNKHDCRSYLLRKNFLIYIVPMINPDGVYNGMFRNDMFGQNLNRVYANCDFIKHPTIWSIKKFAIWLSQNKNVLFYFDFHAHPSNKNFFIYGNSFNEISQQTEAQLFGKMIESNCHYFQNFQSIYTQKQMKVKHKHDSYSKQGCARVFMHKLFNIIHSYTVQCGLFGATKLNQIQNCQRQQYLSTGNYIQDNQFQVNNQKQYSPDSYRLMGKSILVTILDLFGLNPYPKKIKGQICSTHQLRKNYGLKVYHQNEVFKLTDANCYKKLNELSHLIESNYYNEKLKNTGLLLGTNQNNLLLKDQLTYLNASPKTKIMLLNTSKFKKSTSMPKFRTSKQKQKQKNGTSLNYFKPMKQKKPSISLTPQPTSMKTQFINTQSSHNDIKKILDYKMGNINYTYSDVQRFNENDSNPFFNLVQIEDDKKFRKLMPNKNNLLQSLKHNQKQHDQQQQKARAISQGFLTTLKTKQFKPQTKQHKIQSTLQKSITLRKGSLSKIVFIKKEDLKMLRISNIIQKKIQKFSSDKKYKRMINIQRNLLPQIKNSMTNK